MDPGSASGAGNRAPHDGVFGETVTVALVKAAVIRPAQGLDADCAARVREAQGRLQPVGLTHLADRPSGLRQGAGRLCGPEPVQDRRMHA